MSLTTTGSVAARSRTYSVVSPATVLLVRTPSPLYANWVVSEPSVTWASRLAWS